VFLGLHFVLFGFLLFIIVKKRKLWVLENFRWAKGDFRGGFMVFGVFLSFFWVDPVLFGALFDVFCGLPWV